MRWFLALVVAALAAGCAHEGGPAPTTQPTGPTPAVTLPTPPTSTPPLAQPEFDGQNALRHVEAQVQDEYGNPRYRIPGTPGNAEVARYIDATLTELGFVVTWHHFNATYGCEQVPMHNVVAERAGASGRFVTFAAHYDTRPVADKDPDPAKRASPILGANDGASGVGLLLELARVLPNDTQLGVQMLFFDGEDGGGYKAAEGCKTDWILGSRAYAESRSEEQLAQIDALVLVDMIGDPNLTLPREGYSAADPRAAPVQTEVYATAKALGHTQFLDRIGIQVLDDHVPFLERKVAAIDLIHTVPGDARAFPSWHHTLEDDMDVVSADSLHAVGSTLERWFLARTGSV